MERRVINPWTWQDQYGFVQANEVSGAQRTLYCAGQVSVDDGNVLHEGDMAAQLMQSLDNLETVLREAGFALSDVVRLNYFVTDIDAFLSAAETFGTRIAEGGGRPAETVLGVTRLAFPGLLVELEATAAK
jgi:enamine deaminase RidA (YjgF/YER057c/UK114 family)